MKFKLIILFFLVLSNVVTAQSLAELEFGTEETFDIVTWNIEWFPLLGQTTADSVSQIIQSLQADVYALQEISDTTMFKQMINAIPDYDYHFYSNYYGGLAYVFNLNTVNIYDIYEIYTTQPYWRPFPRSPQLMEMNCLGEDYIIINNHFKAFGDGILNLNDPWDEETRRYDAANLLRDYVNANHADDNVIILGDLNDVLTDDPDNNVFINILNDPDNFLFADFDIANGSSNNWSYPGWPSHIDHILITNELFDEFYNINSEIQTIKIDDFLLGGLNTYYQIISDHRPVGLKLSENTFISQNNIAEINSNLKIYPNPFNPITTISFNVTQSSDFATIDIFNLKGQKVKTLDCSNSFATASKGLTHSKTVVWNGTDGNNKSVASGIYFCRFKSGKVVQTKKMLLLK